MADLRFPSNALGGGKPFILFSTHKAKYDNFGAKINVETTGNSVALYFPTNYNVADTLTYGTESTGLIGSAYAAGVDVTSGDALEIVKGLLTNKSTAAGIAGFGAAGLATLGAGGFAGLLGGGLVGSVIGNVAAEESKTAQVALNPREFMLFKSPEIRQFAFNFTFIPSNEQEVNAIPEIIKFFRRASYPELHSANAVYNFPEAFNINFGNSDSLIKIPEVFCTAVNTTYNPSSMSYFQLNNMPVEINMQVSFRELQPINRGFVDQGY
jgi:hypothetical protein